LRKALHLFHQLHFDIALGAVGSSYWLGLLLGNSLSMEIALTLGLAVWVIYLSDHLLDAHRYAHRSMNRYGFYLKNRKWLLAAIVLGLLAGIYPALQLPEYIFTYGLGIGAMVLFYLGVVQLFPYFSRLFKELWVALLYACGIGLPYFALPDNSELYLLMLWVFFLALCTLLMYSIIEEPDDIAMGLPSLAKTVGASRLLKLHDTLLAFVFVLLLYGFYTFQSILWLLPAGVMFILALILRKYSSTFRHRCLGEGIFLMPWLSILL
jgi:hypothetical protein